MSVAAVTSALNRARATLRQHYTTDAHDFNPRRVDASTRALLDRYVRAWESADVAGLLALFKEEATFAMPPSPSWYAGRVAIGVMLARELFAGDAHGRWRLQPTSANARAAFGLYACGADDVYHPAALLVLGLSPTHISTLTAFFDPALLPHFGLPLQVK